jgi:hypothetical protein
MGMLSAAFLTGLGQGGQVLAGGMLKEVERQGEQDIWQKRQTLLAAIQRENAKNIQEDALTFRETNAPRTRALDAGDVTARGDAARGVKITDMTDPGVVAAEQAKAERDRAEKVKDAGAAVQADIDAAIAKGGNTRYTKALRTIRDATTRDTTDYKGRELDNAVKQMALDNAKRADGLRKEFGAATPERQSQIKDELSVLTGKDTDKFMPVPLKDEMGATTGYKIFDTKAGRWVDEGAKGGGDPLKAAMDAARDAKGGKPKAEAKPTDEPAKPGMLASMVASAGNMGQEARAQGAAYEAIDRRVREAGSGGPSLSAQEKADARRFGIVVR